MAQDEQPGHHGPRKQDYMAERIAAFEEYKTVRSLLEQFSQLIREADAERPAYVAVIPLRDRDDESPTRIVPEEYSDARPARAKAADVITATVIREHQHPATVWRAPGLLAASAQTIELAHEVNAAKARLHQAVQKISPVRKTRVDEMRRVVPFIALKQCYRAIPILERRPRNVNFTWAVNGARAKQRTVAEWFAYLAELHGEPWEGYEPSRWEEMLGAAERRLAQLPEDEVLVQRQPVAPHPRANVWFYEEQVMYRCSLPMLYPDDGDQIIPYKPLGVADRRIRRAPRRNRAIEEEPLSRLLHLYRYRADARRQARS